MIRASFVALFLDLQYHEMNLASGAQTIRLGGAGPVSFLHGRATLAGGCALWATPLPVGPRQCPQFSAIDSC